MSGLSAAGERAALRGYRWQYDHIATRVYDALFDNEFLSLRLTDPNAGRVDDLVLVRRGRTDGYQFKSVEFDRPLTFKQILRSQRTPSGNSSPSLLRSLADGWKRLQGRKGNVHVHLVTQQFASVNDRLGDGDDPDRPSPDHFSAFISEVLEPLRLRNVSLDDIGAGWRSALTKLHEDSGLGMGEFNRFLRSLHLDVNAGSGLPARSSIWRSDVIDLSNALLRLVSKASSVVELDEPGVLALMGWQGRPRLRSRHDFPVDLDTYAPLEDAIEELDRLISIYDSGYIAVIGPPGSGKSTLLSQALTGTADRIIRYYAFVPGTSLAQTRLTARGFLHDVVVMLNERGIVARERELPSDDVHKLRQQLADQLDTAGEEFKRTRCRTIIVVDGLDHVDRDHPGTDGLLAELPRPGEMPNGVLFIVGSRALNPLHPYAHQQLDERDAIVDLQHHRLSPASVLEICRRASVTADLGLEVHRRVADLSDGYPLALGYILNRLRDVDGETAEDPLAALLAYKGDVAAEYRAVWDDVGDDSNVVEMLSVCSRLRIGFTTEWLRGWATPSAVRTFQHKLRYLFRSHHDGWRFFHDSFQQFAADRTAPADTTLSLVRAEALSQERVAELCANTDDPTIAAEQLYHRYRAGQHDEVLLLAEQERFRQQYQRLRSPNLIRQDVELALGIAAERADVLAMLRLLLAFVEVTERTSALDEVDMPSLLYKAGLVNEAIAYCGGETRRVPLAHAYALAATLGGVNDPAGRRLFDLTEHQGLDDADRMRVSGEEDDAAVAWAHAAALFRPLPAVIASIGRLIEGRPEGARDDRHTQARRWRRYERMFQALIDAVALRADESALNTIDAALAEHAAGLIEGRHQSEAGDEEESGGDTRTANAAMVIDLRVRSHAVLLKLAPTDEDRRVRLNQLRSMLRGVPMYPSTMLEVAELLACHGMVDQASELLYLTPYGKALAVSVLSGYDKSDSLDCRFRYWRLRHLLGSREEDVPAVNIPAGNEITPSTLSTTSLGSTSSDIDAIWLTALDAAARTLGWLDAATISGQPVPVNDAWTALAPLLDISRPSESRGSWIGQGEPGLMRIIVDVAISYGNGLPRRLSDVLTSRFREQPERWFLNLRLDLADRLRSAGVSAPWYRETLTELEEYAVTQDVSSRLRETADLVGHHARNGDRQTARRLALNLIPMAFSVGWRKDYQFDSWVAWLGQALAGPGGDRLVDEAAWLARVLTAVDPMTEHGSQSAAADLPAAVVPVDPMAAVRVFEYLVRHGTVHHLDALAALVRGLVINAGADEMAMVELAADMTSEMIAPAANSAYPKLAASLVAASRWAGGRAKGAILAESVAGRTDTYALPTTRTGMATRLGPCRQCQGTRRHRKFG